MRKQPIVQLAIAMLLPFMWISPAISEKASGKGSPGTAAHSFFFVGDAGGILEPSANLLRRQLQKRGSKGALFYLGDNVYTKGIPEPSDRGYANAVAQLQQLIGFGTGSGIKTVFVPGNHDWDSSGAKGWDSIRRQQAMVVEALGDRSYAPKDGCPGPLRAYSDEHFEVIAIDTQWWLHSYDKPNAVDDGCDTFSEETILARLEDMLSASKGKKVVIIQHHPLMSYGMHGVSMFPSVQDIGHERYENMRNKLGAVLSKNPPFICAAGHDHDLQVIRGNSWCQKFIVSGSTSKPREVTNGKHTIFASSTPGVIRLDRFANGKVRLRAVAIDKEGEKTGVVLYEKFLDE